MCSPPANLSKAETSALRQHGLVIESRPNSSLTASVIAIFTPSNIDGVI
jgi:hypothetical protein